MENRTKIELPNGMVIHLKTEPIEEDIDLDRITTIDMANIAAEIITTPVLLNKFGILLAEMNEKVSRKKLQCEIIEAKIKAKARESMYASADDDDDEIDPKKPKKKIITGRKLSNDEVDTKVICDPLYQQVRRGLINAQKEAEYMNSAYWSLKDKSGKLDKMSNSLTTGDIISQLVESKLNRLNFVNLKIMKSELDKS